jgi:hypothetical protein
MPTNLALDDRLIKRARRAISRASMLPNRRSGCGLTLDRFSLLRLLTVTVRGPNS